MRYSHDSSEIGSRGESRHQWLASPPSESGAFVPRPAALFQLPGKPGFALLLLLYIAAIVLAYYTLVSPGTTFVRIWMNDVMALLNAAYRVFEGQVPAVDFKSLYGPVVFYPTALGLHLGLQHSAIFAFGGVVVAGFVLLAGVAMMTRRFTLPMSLACLLFLYLLLVIPIASGKGFQDISWGTYYNRQGWAVLTLLLLFYVPPAVRVRCDKYLDGFVLAALALFLIYSKITFGLVALAFVAANAFVHPYNRAVSLIALALMILGAVLTELALGLHADYLLGIGSAGSNNSLLRNGLWGLLERTVLEQAWVYVVCASAMLALWLTGRRSILDVGFMLGVVVTGPLLLETTGGSGRGMPSFLAVCLCFGELARRTQSQRHGAWAWGDYSGYLVCAMLSIMLIAGPVGMRLLAWHDHYVHSSSANGQPVPGLPAAIAGFYVREEPWRLHQELGHSDAAHDILWQVRRSDRRPPTPYEYLQTIAEGAALLQTIDLNEKILFVLDNADPFTPALGLEPTSQGYPFLWLEAVANVDNYLPGAKRFSGVDLVMSPVIPHQTGTYDTLIQLYGEYLGQHFYEIARSPHWRLLARKQ